MLCFMYFGTFPLLLRAALACHEERYWRSFL